MPTENNIVSGTTLGTVSGTALTVVVNIGSSDLIKTGVLAAFGAVVSFCMSVLLKWLTRKLKR
jgi:putative Ca2+/H+ antiporter (TMEM165/GDT1 family)